MNRIFKIDKTFDTLKNNGAGSSSIPNNGSVNTRKINKLISELKVVQKYWLENNEFKITPIIHVVYTRIIAKSNRISRMFSYDNKTIFPDDIIIGAKFVTEEEYGISKQKHQITYSVTMNNLQNTIDNLEKLAKYVDSRFGGNITHDDCENIDVNKSLFKSLLRDCYYVDRIITTYKRDDIDLNDNLLITLYDIGEGNDITSILSKIGIESLETKKLDNMTFLFEPKDIDKINENIKYLVAMSVKDIFEYNFDIDNSSNVNNDNNYLIRKPTEDDKYYIGCIDTVIDEDTPFKEWIDYVHMLPEDIKILSKDKRHGTHVSSLLVAGNVWNPGLDDNCGLFRVKHFGIAAHNKMSSFETLKKIEWAVKNNPEIKVWNLSIASDKEIFRDFISPEAAFLDKLQYEYDVIFIISGSNDEDKTMNKMIGAPADSINGLVVNSHDKDNKPSNYSRRGPVLSFFVKPDVSYFEEFAVCSGLGKEYARGTSMSAPWITRKIAYLIYKLKLSKEVAKALIIDSARSFKLPEDYDQNFMGHGIVPTRIEDIYNGKNNEIKFFLEKEIDCYQSRTLDIPVPSDSSLYNYIARATLCYTTKGSRIKGVDYTDYELDLYFGRVQEKNGKPAINCINKNTQLSEDNFITEEEARKIFRKWDNVKIISDKFSTKKPMSKKKYGNYEWGIKIAYKMRNSNEKKPLLKYGVIITLSNILGQDRKDEFIQLCKMRKWTVTEIDIEQEIDTDINIDIDIKN